MQDTPNPYQTSDRHVPLDEEHISKLLLQEGVYGHVITQIYIEAREKHPSMLQNEQQFFPYFLTWIREHSSIKPTVGIIRKIRAAIARHLPTPHYSTEKHKHEKLLEVRDIDEKTIDVDAIYNEFVTKNKLNVAIRQPIPQIFRKGARVTVTSVRRQTSERGTISRQFRFGSPCLVKLEGEDQVENTYLFSNLGKIIGWRDIGGRAIELDLLIPPKDNQPEKRHTKIITLLDEPA